MHVSVFKSINFIDLSSNVHNNRFVFGIVINDLIGFESALNVFMSSPVFKLNSLKMPSPEPLINFEFNVCMHVK